jgi:hypothetical protein
MNENLKFDLVSAHIRSLHPEWSADRVFTESLEASGHSCGFGRSIESNVGEAIDTDGGPKLVRGAKKADRHPAIIEELSKHFQLQEQRKKWGEVAHANRLKRIRELMQQNGWNFDQAFTETMREEAQTAQAPAKAAHESESDTLATVQASHCDWTLEQCEEFCWTSGIWA